MKKFLLILTLLVSFATPVLAQEGDNDDKKDRLQELMTQYIQKRLHLTRNEADKFTPVFLRYIKEVRRIHRENPDVLIRQQRIVELRIQSRTEFKEIMGDERANGVFKHEKDFLDKIRTQVEENRAIEKRRGPQRRFRSMIQ